MARVAPEATAFPARLAPFDLVLISLWDDAVDDSLQIDWTRRFHAAMEPWSADEIARVPDAYGRNFARLADVKARFDPENRFRHNQNVQPRACTSQAAMST
jgi:FAD/FMN-containing dehydrogenase